MVALIITLAISSPVLANDAVVRIGTDATYPPFEYKDPAGAYQGFEVELLQRICADQHLNCSFIDTNFDNLMGDLYGQKIDVIASQMSITEGRKKLVDFTDVVTAAPVAWVARKSSGITGEPGSFKGMSIGVKNDPIYANYAKATLQGPLTITAYSSFDMAYEDLLSGKIDAFLGDKFLEWDWLSKTGQQKGFQFVGKAIYDANFFGVGTGFAVRKGDATLLRALNDGLAKAIKGGTFKTLNDKYFPFSVGAPVP